MSASRSHSTKTLAAVVRLVRPYRLRAALAFVALGVGSGISLLLPEVIRRALDAAERPEPWQFGAIVILLFALQSVAFYARSVLFGRLGHDVVADVRDALFQATIARPLEFFDARRTADLTSRLSVDALGVQELVSVRLSVVIRYALQVCVGAICMLRLSWQLTILLFLIGPVIAACSIALGRRLKSRSTRMQEALARVMIVADETFSGIRIVKAFNAAPAQASAFRARNREVRELGAARAALAAFFSSSMSFLLNAGIVAVVVYGFVLVRAGSLPFADLTAFVLYGMIVAVSFAFLTGGYTDTLQALGAAERVAELLEPVSRLPVAGAAPPFRTAPRIEFDDVEFAYPTRPDLPALRGLSVVIPAGSVTALVGPSGAGKSTMVNLILGLYEASRGSVTIDGVRTGDYEPSSLRSGIALVPQETVLFGTSIAENLRLARSDATDDELWRACRDARIEDFIRSLPSGLETPIGDRGTQLSGGQRQRLAIARALLRDAPLIILDEPTSSLDSENESGIFEALRGILPGRTCIIIAHRLATTQRADHVVVLAGGRVTETGTHESLIRHRGLYHQLVEQQQLHVS